MKALFRSSILIGLSTLPILAAEDVILGDFEGDSYAPWTTTGDAFGPAPAKGALPGQMPVTGFQGKGLANSFNEGDDTTGTLTSPPFTIERNHIAFLIGGGKRPGKLELQLVIDGQVALRAFGSQDKPGGTEALEAGFWNVAELKGKTATLRIIDQAKGGWGHLSVDHLVQTEAAPTGLLHDPSWTADSWSHQLSIPIRNGAPKRLLTLMDGDQVLVRNEVELADTSRDGQWQAVMDVRPFEKEGRKLRLHVDRMRPTPDPLRAEDIFPPVNADLPQATYDEPLRPQYHFSSARGWLNDPNGCVYYNGEYHLFYQHNPYGITWGNMHWGHAVSPDLVHWKELGDALFPDESGMMYSGSAVVDWKNTSGLGKDGKPPLILFYTAAGDEYTQCMAWSTDGRTFTKYAENPVVKQVTHGNRDPKVIWHEPTKQWVMTVYVELNKVHTIHFYTSPDLKHWTYTSKVDGFFECPDLFELPVDGDPAKKKWVLTAADSGYEVGSFDGKTFTPEGPKRAGHRGKGFYAAQTFSDVPDGRRILIGWWQTETKGMPFNQSMSLPMELHLVSTDDGPRLTYTPVKELEKLRMKGPIQNHFDDLRSIPEGMTSFTAPDSDLYEIRADIEPHGSKTLLLQVRGHVIICNFEARQIVVDNSIATAPLQDGRLKLTIYCDRTGIEVFADGGLCYMPVPNPGKDDPDARAVHFISSGGGTILHSLGIYNLRSAWK